jgi:hypothetical protein
MRWPFRLRPPPPPPPPVYSFPRAIAAALILSWAIYTVCLIAFARGKLPRLQLVHAPYAWLCVLFVAATIIASRDDDPPEWATFGRVPLESDLGVMHLLFRIMPIAGFFMLLVSEISAWLFALGSPDPDASVYMYLRHPAMAVHAASFIYYVHELFISTYSMLDAFDRPVIPLRYVLWNTSVSCMLVSMYFAAECALRSLGATATALNKLHTELAYGLLYTDGTFTAGFLATRSQTSSEPHHPWPRPSAHHPPSPRSYCTWQAVGREQAAERAHVCGVRRLLLQEAGLH